MHRDQDRLQPCSGITSLLLLLAIALPCVAYPVFGKTLRVGVFQDQQTYLNKLTVLTECPPLSSHNIADNQMLFEYLLLCNAINASELDLKIQRIGFPIATRLSSALEKGDADVSGFGIWYNESNVDHVTRSVPLMRKGEFAKGIYTTKDVHERWVAQQKTGINHLVAVSNRNWTFDWQVLECAGASLVHVDTYAQMFQILDKKRADVLPLGFNSQADLSKDEYGVKLLPLPGIKLVFPDSTHLVISNHFAQSKQLIEAINTYLTRLRQTGDLTKHYEQLGVISPQTANWTTLCE